MCVFKATDEHFFLNVIGCKTQEFRDFALFIPRSSFGTKLVLGRLHKRQGPFPFFLKTKWNTMVLLVNWLCSNFITMSPRNGPDWRARPILASLETATAQDPCSRWQHLGSLSLTSGSPVKSLRLFWRQVTWTTEGLHLLTRHGTHHSGLTASCSLSGWKKRNQGRIARKAMGKSRKPSSKREAEHPPGCLTTNFWPFQYRRETLNKLLRLSEPGSAYLGCDKWVYSGRLHPPVLPWERYCYHRHRKPEKRKNYDSFF